MGLLDQPTLTELSETIRFVIPTEDRDFSTVGNRPRDSYMAQSLPGDMGMADDEKETINPFLKTVQKFMKTKPLGASYSGATDGIMNSELRSALFEFESKLEQKTNQSVIGTIVMMNSVSQSGMTKAIELLRGSSEESKAENTESGNNSVKTFQEFFSVAHPVIGTLYSGPKDGNMNDELISAMQSAESKITAHLSEITPGSNVSAAGQIWTGKSFKTTTDDISEALNIMQNHKKTAILHSTDRNFVFSSILSK